MEEWEDAVKTVRSIAIHINLSPPSETLPSGSKPKCLHEPEN